MTSQPVILDATCACRSMWFQKDEPHTLFVDQRELDGEKRFGSKDSLRHYHIAPDVIASFTDLPFPDNTFWHVVFDPPHLIHVSDNAWLYLKYGRLPTAWQDVIRAGFTECMRVLKPNGTMIFKWSDLQISTPDVIKAIGVQPLYGHRSGKKMNTNWMAFMKFDISCVAEVTE